MKIAIIGKGLAGLGVAYYLCSQYDLIDLYFDQEGASQAASGLMHPYVGETGKKSFNADGYYEEALRLWKTLAVIFIKRRFS